MRGAEQEQEAEQRLSACMASRRAKLAVCTRKRNEIKSLMVDDVNLDDLNRNYEAFMESVHQFRSVHKCVQEFLSEEDKITDYEDWFEPRMMNIEYFIKEFKEWREHHVAQTKVRPQDSVSQTSSLSGSSSTHSAKLKAKAEHAALEAEAAALKRKHILLLKEAELRSQLEQVEIEGKLAAANAKILALQDDGENVDKQEDGMNEYLDQYKQEQHKDERSPVEENNVDEEDETEEEFKRLDSAPKTPLQTFINTTPIQALRRRANVRQPTLSPPQTSRAKISHNASNNSNQAQTDIAQLIISQQKLSSLPVRNLTVFDGDPLTYLSFMNAFQHLIEEKTNNNHDRLYYLEQFTSGLPRDLVRSCLHMDANRGYGEAKRLLKDYFGNEIKISQAYLDKAVNWSVIKAEDKKALHAYALYLRGCWNVMQDLNYMDELDNSSNLRLIASKLPYKLREKWRTAAYEMQLRSQRRVKFQHLVEFVERQARLMMDPLFGDIQDQNPAKKTLSRNKALETRTSKPRNSSFATSVAVNTESENTSAKSSVNLKQQDELKVSQSCGYCQGKHAISECRKLRLQEHKDRVDFLKTKGHCFGCLLRGHLSKDCKKRLTCQVCQMKHPTILHKENVKTKEEETMTKETSISNALISAQDATGAGKDFALAVVPVRVKLARSNRSILTYAFLDPGSTATFCTTKLMDQLNAKGRKTTIILQTMGQETPTKTYEITGLEVGNLNGDVYLDLPKVYTQGQIPVSKGNIITEKDLKKWPHLKEVKLKRIDADIDLLIGTNVPKAIEPWHVVNSENDGPFAWKTLLGWVVSGPLKTSPTTEPVAVTSNRISVLELRDLLVEQYNQDFSENKYEEKREMSVEDKQFMKIVTNSVCYKDGHYHLPLPLKNKYKALPNNYTMAKERTQSLKRRFKRDSEYASEYTAFMEDMLEKGYAEKVPQDQITNNDGHVWYIPHHGVYHKKKLKLRVVFDCTASYQGTSLNDELLQGPDLTNTLIGVLLRFRQGQIAVMADIEAMFYQVCVNKSDRNYLRFLWWPNGNISKELEVYRMNVHLFGAVSSPSIANFALRQTAEDNKSHYDEEVLQTIKTNFYVDDCLKSLIKVDHATKFCKDLESACKRGGFTLTRWVSNSHEVLESIPACRRAPLMQEMDLGKEHGLIERALGLQWNVKEDTFVFKAAAKEKPATKRGILSVVGSAYDPLGFLAPFVLKAKQILQELCKSKCGWDETIPEEYTKSWQRWLRELNQLTGFHIDRCMTPKNVDSVEQAELHHFCDASESGYGTVSYLRFTTSQNQIHIAFVFGKARVAPIKQITVPRLELTAATLAVKIDRMLRKEMQMSLNDSTFWTDSTAVLKYIHNQTSRFHTFVSNRLAIIHDLSLPKQWRHVNSKENPADDASRGLHVDSFLKSRWLKGPTFLQKTKTEWPNSSHDTDVISEEDPEVKKIAIVHSLNVEKENPVNTLINYFSSWSKLLRAVAWILKVRKGLHIISQRKSGRLLQNQSLKAKWHECQTTRDTGHLDIENIREAEKALIRFEQCHHFKKEVDLLEQGKPVSLKSSISRLDPIMEKGILRVGGRINKATISEDQINPIILPKTSRVSTLILRHIHHQVGHFGRNHMLSRLRQRFWLPHANTLARKIIRKCVYCQRMQAKPAVQKMADLPEDRIKPDLPPFSHVGIDYFGPIDVKRGRSHVKRWGVIFTCLVSRAVHLEMAHSLTTDSCINVIRKFICRRGPVLSIRTDCGTNFVGAQRELKDVLKEINEKRLSDSLLLDGVKWIFNPPLGAHHGGVWERLIKLVKRTLMSVLKQQTLDDETLQTALCEVEAILNDRPITPASNDPKDLEPLTPNHLLQLKTKATLPPGLFIKEDLYSRRRWRQAQYLADLFWKRWIKEYLPLLQERNKWHHKTRNLQPDDLVIIVDDNAPRSSWTMGRVMKTFPDAQGFVRSVLVKTKTTVLQRPISKLCLLQTD